MRYTVAIVISFMCFLFESEGEFGRLGEVAQEKKDTQRVGEQAEYVGEKDSLVEENKSEISEPSSEVGENAEIVVNADDGESKINASASVKTEENKSEISETSSETGENSKVVVNADDGESKINTSASVKTAPVDYQSNDENGNGVTEINFRATIAIRPNGVVVANPEAAEVVNSGESSNQEENGSTVEDNGNQQEAEEVAVDVSAEQPESNAGKSSDEIQLEILQTQLKILEIQKRMAEEREQAQQNTAEVSEHQPEG